MESREKFIRAIEFCLKVDGHDGELHELATWTLSPDHDASVPGDPHLSVALVSGGATRIKSYIFESARLPEIRGASSLLDKINREDLPGLWLEAEPNGIGSEDCVIYSNGGEILAFAPVCKAPRLADEIERLYTHHTMIAQSVAVWQAFELSQIRNGLLYDVQINEAVASSILGYNPTDNNTFGSLIVPLAMARFRRREANDDQQRRDRHIAHIDTVPFARRCSSCERRAAVVNARVSEDEERPLCEPCGRKRIFGQLTKREDTDERWWERASFRWQPKANDESLKSWPARFEDWVMESPELNAQYAFNNEKPVLEDLRSLVSVNDLGEIGEVSNPKGFIGLIYADGNNVGQLLEHLKTPFEYSAFANGVYRGMEGAVFEALAGNLQPGFIQRFGVGTHVHPFEILSIGGDDLILIVPAHTAIPVACDIATILERRLLAYDPMFESRNADGSDALYDWSKVQRCRGAALTKQCTVGLSVGVVIADAHTPMFYLQELASQLLNSAKSRAKWLNDKHNYFGGTMDFLTLKSVTTISGTLGQFRSSALTKDNRRLYARPYTLAEMQTLMDTIGVLKEASFPRSQLYRLRDSLRSSVSQGTVDYRYFLYRDRDLNEAREKIESLWTPVEGHAFQHPWRDSLHDSRLESIWFDVVELYDFTYQFKKEETNAATED